MLKWIKQYRYDIAILLAIIFFPLLSYFFDWDTRGVFSSRETLQGFIESFGAIGPIVMILLIIAEVIVAPIPGYLPAVTAGFVFGPMLGALYVYVGNVIGTLIVFFLTRKYGRYIAEKLFDLPRLKKYEAAIARHENLLLAFFLVPIMPLDIITAAFGLSQVKTEKFIATILVTYLIYAIGLSLFGDSLARLLL